MNRVKGDPMLLRFLALLAIVTCGCAAESDPPCNPEPLPGGTLISSGGSWGLQLTSFPDGAASVVTHPENFNYGECVAHGPSGMLIVSSGTTISEVNSSTGEMVILRDGGFAVWEPMSDSLVYWHGLSQKSADQRLFVAGLHSQDAPAEICGVPAPISGIGDTDYYLLSKPVVLGEGRVAVLNENRNVCILNPGTGELIPTLFKDCWPQATRGDGRTLFCTDINTWKVFEIDLLESMKTELPGMSGTGYLFLEGSNSLLFSASKGSLSPIPHETTVTQVYSIGEQTTCTLETIPTINGERTIWIPS
jgi:hypothetical protein